MSIERIDSSNLRRAAELLKAGRLVAFPTDTYYALGAVMSQEAVEGLFTAKGRMEGNPVPVLVASVADLDQLTIGTLNSASRCLAGKFWPGALTLVLPARSSVPSAVTAGSDTVGVRVPDHDIARELIRLAESPLTGTSANISGRPPCKTADEVIEQLDGIIAAVVDAPCGQETAPSTVVRPGEQGIEILRLGSISEEAIRAALGSA